MIGLDPLSGTLERDRPADIAIGPFAFDPLSGAIRWALGFSPSQIFTALQGFWGEPDLVYGPELVVNGTFDTDTTGWSNGPFAITASVESGQLKLVCQSVANAYVYQSVSTVAGKTYKISFNATATIGSFRVQIYAANDSTQITSASSSSALVFVATGDQSFIRLVTFGGAIGNTSYFDNISVKEIVPSTVFQDTAGTTPCTLDTTCALLLDKSQGLALGPELVTNGDFSSSAGWTLGAATGATPPTISGGELIFNSESEAYTYGRRTLNLPLVAGRTYALSIECTAYTKGTAQIVFAGATTQALLQNINSTGKRQIYFVANSANVTVEIGRFIGPIALSITDISVRELAGNHAVQPTAANRPLFSAKYNLLNNSQQIQSSPWALRTGTIVATGNYAAGVDGTITAAQLSKTVTADSRWQYAYSAMAPSTTYTASIYFKKTAVNAVSELGFRLSFSSGAPDCYAMIDTLTGTTAIRGGGTGTVTSQSVGDYWKLIITKTSPTGTVIDAGLIIAPYLGSNIASPDFAAIGSCVVWGADLRLASTPANIPSYQYVNTATDYATTGFPYFLRHDSNDFLTASLPAINVRRNLLTYSEQFDNAVWTKLNSSVVADVVLAPDGTPTADTLFDNTSNTQHSAQRQLSLSNVQYTFSVFAKANGVNYISFLFAGFTYASFNLTNGTTATSGASIVALPNGWYRCIFTATVPDALSRVYAIYTNTGAGITYAGTGTTGLYIWGAQLELGSTATAYQKVTDWTSELFSSNGATYLATPVGMSLIENQSIGTSYNLPAPSSDIYDWVVVPERLNAATEAKLERYFLQKAGLPSPDYFDQVDYGPELVTSTWSSPVAGSSVTNGVFTFDGVTSIANSAIISTNTPAVSIVAGTRYFVSYRIVSNLTNGISLNIGGTTGTARLFTGSYSEILIATNTTGPQIMARLSSGARTGSIDNISVRELKDGVNGYLTEDDGVEILIAQ